MRPPPPGSRAAALAWLLAPLPALASAPVVWEHPPRPAGAAEVRREGRELAIRDDEAISGVASGSGGALTLSATLREVFPAGSKMTPPAVLWAAGLGRDGSLLLGTGNGGEILRLDAKGSASSVFDADELGVRALAVGPADELYAGTFPAGAVFRIAADEDAEVYFEPEDRYIWTMLAGPAGDLIVGTGERGVIYQVSGPSRSSVLFDSDGAHVTSLAFDASGQLLAGTDPDGLVYRIGTDGRAEVLLDSDLREVPALAVTPEGTIYAAAISEEPFQPTPRQGGRGDLTIEVTPTSDGGILEEPADLPRKITIDLAELIPAPPAGVEGTTGRLYRLDPGRPAALVWKSDTERIHALAYSAGFGLLFGTGGGPEGRLYRLEADGSASLLHRFREPQVTGLAAGADGRVYVCTSNPGRVYLLDPAPVSSGNYTSSVFDAGRAARWGAIAWDADIPAGTRLEITTRSGNRPAPDATWSRWSPPYAEPRGSAVGSPAGRYIQWKAELSRIKTDAAPLLRRVRVTLLPQNTRPVVTAVQVLAPGAAWQPPTAAGPGPKGPTRAGSSEPAESRTPPAGARWVSWTSDDQDGDALHHALWLRRVGEESFQKVALAVDSPPYALDTRELAEGPWLVKVEVDDARANGSEAGLSSAASSDAFLVDRTAPKLEARQAEGIPARAGRIAVEIRASDAVGTIASAQYCLGDAREPACWIDLACRDRICDAGAETFLLDLPVPEPARRLEVRVHDASGNTASLEVPIPSASSGRGDR